jgi:hypothetical protein
LRISLPEEFEQISAPGILPKNAFKRLFQATVRYSPVRDAGEVLRGKKISDKLKALFSACQVSRALAPRLQVREKK